MSGVKGFNAAPFRNSLTSLKVTSKDDGDGEVTYMTESNLRVYNFDSVMKKYVLSLPDGRRPEGPPPSVDALVRLVNGDCVLVEFKNGVLGRKAVAQVREKVLSSVLALGDLLDYTLEEIRQHVDFVLVYNEHKNRSGRPEDEPSSQSVSISESRRKITAVFSEKGSTESSARCSRPEFRIRKTLRNFCVREVSECTEFEFDQEHVANWECVDLK